MKQIFIVLIFALSALTSVAQWKPAGDKIKPPWAENVAVNNVLPEYPRRIMERADWQNLNGLWNYAITDAGQMQPANFDGEILVPFAVESSLSGVQKTVGENKELWYQRTFEVPSAWKGEKILLHFGAVDWTADVWVNDIKVGSHKGGYYGFTFDVTPFLNKSGEQNTGGKSMGYVRQRLSTTRETSEPT